MIKIARMLMLIVAILLFTTSQVHADFEKQVTLVPAGGIAIIGFNFDGVQEFSFVCTSAIPANTEIRFTDNGWTSGGAFRTGEGFLSWYTPGGCSVGQVVNIRLSDWANNITDQFAFSTDGDQILVYQFISTNNYHFIFGLNSEDIGWQGSANSANTSALPPGLDSTNSIALIEIDNSVYTGLKNFTSVSAGLASIVDVAKWSGSDAVRQVMPTGSFNFAYTAVELEAFTAKNISPIPFAVVGGLLFFAVIIGLVMIQKRKSAQE